MDWSVPASGCWYAGRIAKTTIGERLKKERERFGFSQTAFAALAGQSKRAQIRYESGERSPDAEYLARLARRKVDIYWIVTGRKR